VSFVEDLPEAFLRKIRKNDLIDNESEGII